MRRLPIFFLIDVSESMVDHLNKIDNAIQTMVRELSCDPYAIETAFVSTIVFAGKAKVLNPLTDMLSLSIPNLPLGGGTGYGQALECLMKQIDCEVVKSTMEIKGDWKPLVFMFTDGNPTDNYKDTLKKWTEEYKTKTSFVVFSLAPEIDYSILGKLTDEIYSIDSLDQETIKNLFKWVSASIQTSSEAVGDNRDNNFKEDIMPTISAQKIHRIDLKKKDITTSSYNIIDENFKYLLGKCANRRLRYLIKYKKENSTGLYREIGTFKLPDENLYDLLSQSDVIGKDFNVSNIDYNYACLPCPHCENEIKLSKCSCGKLFCSPILIDTGKLTCPWCGKTDYYSCSAGFDVGSGLG